MRNMNKLILEATTPEEAEDTGGSLLSGPYEDSAAAREAAEEKHKDKDVTFAADDDDKWYIYMKEGKTKKLQHALDIVEGFQKTFNKGMSWPSSKKDPAGRDMTPDAVVNRVKGFSDEELMDLDGELDPSGAGSARQLQLQAIKRELKRRGIKESRLTSKSREELITEIQSLIEYYRVAHDSDVYDVLSDLQDLIQGDVDVKKADPYAKRKGGQAQKDMDLEMRARRARQS